jgi:hypothetical protein
MVDSEKSSFSMFSLSKAFSELEQQTTEKLMQLSYEPDLCLKFTLNPCPLSLMLGMQRSCLVGIMLPFGGPFSYLHLPLPFLLPH